MTRRATRTSNFGSGARQSHDASAFYDRFRAPVISDDDEIAPPTPVDDPFRCGDSRDLSAIADNSVALVVTSPPYFAGKQYEEELGADGVPASYLDYLEMLTDVFAECVRVLEPGGRIAVNVANLGRRPYRSLAADVIRILEHDLGLLLRGEVVWQKADGAGGSCAWGSYRKAGNPVLRDVTERVIIASKGRFDRARSVRQRTEAGLPHRSTITTDDFLAATLDIWELAPESARRIGHPAPFPVELPERLIRLYTYVDDLVIDPFMGSGSTLVAAARLGRRYIGYDLDPDYVELARGRVTAALEDLPVEISADDALLRADALAEGLSAERLAAEVIAAAGFSIVDRNRRVRGTGVTIDVVARAADDTEYWFMVAGPFSAERGGMQRGEVVWRTLGRAAAVRGARGDTALVVVTTDLPREPSDMANALSAATPGIIDDVVQLLASDGRRRLATLAAGDS